MKKNSRVPDEFFFVFFAISKLSSVSMYCFYHRRRDTVSKESMAKIEL
jgi:hypothetical protein